MDSPSGLLWCLSVKGSVHHWREKWATSAVHWLSSTLPPPNKTRSSWTTWRENSTYSSLRLLFFLLFLTFHFIYTFLRSRSLQKFTHLQAELQCAFVQKVHILYIYVHSLKHTFSLWSMYSHIQTHTSSSSLPSFSPHCSAGEPALTWLTKIPVPFPPTIVISSARLALLYFGVAGGLEDGEWGGILKNGMVCSNW